MSYMASTERSGFNFHLRVDYNPDSWYDQDMDIQNEKTYDSVFWTSVVKMKQYFIPLVNEAFGEHFTDKAVVQLGPGKQANQMPDESFKRGELDAYATLTEMSVSKQYHFEVETRGNRGIFIRIAEYALGIAQDNIEVTERGIEVTLPHSAVIFLKKADDMPDKMSMIFKGDSGEIINDVPVIKIKDYSVSSLLKKKLLLLLPFYGFNFDGKFADMEQSGIGELKAALDEINDGLVRMVDAGEINESQHSHLIDWTKRVLEKLTINYKNVTKGVDDLMGGYILHTRTDDILDQGRAEGQNAMIEAMLRKGRTPEEIVDLCGVPLQQVKKVEQSMLVTV